MLLIEGMKQGPAIPGYCSASPLLPVLQAPTAFKSELLDDARMRIYAPVHSRPHRRHRLRYITGPASSTLSSSRRFQLSDRRRCLSSGRCGPAIATGEPNGGGVLLQGALGLYQRGLMCADRDSSASPGLRALLGRFLHGLLQFRVFQLFGAAWSYLTGLSGGSFFSFLPSAWVVHRSVGPDELPEMLEALGLRSGPWEELGECLDELGPWKDLLSPADLDIMNPWKGYGSSSKDQESWDNALQELGTWHSKMQTLWEPGLGPWKDLVDPDQEVDDECCSKSAANDPYVSHRMSAEDGPCDVDHEKSAARFHSAPLGMVSCIFNPASGGVFTWLDLGNEPSLQDKDVHDETSTAEIEHIRNKRLWFLQQNQSQDVPTTELKDPAQNLGTGQDDPALPIKLELPVTDWHDGHHKDFSPDLDLDQSSVMELSGSDPDSKLCPPLSLLIQKPLISSNTQSTYPPSPDQDQGYHSLEDWQCLNIKQNLQFLGISPPDTCESVMGDDGLQNPTKILCPDVTDDMDSDAEETHAPAIPACTNKHIGYILGTVVSDDEEEDSSSSCDDDDDDWDEDDDGFDSEGSVSPTEADVSAADEVVLWNSFCSVDPYNPQNFTASLHTGSIVEVESHLEDQAAVISEDEESWCDSDAVSDSDSEDEFSINEQENLKLWNGFLKSEDPYNPLCFKASVHTAERKGQSSDAATKHLELVCYSPSSSELTVPTHPCDAPLLRLREKRSMPMEESANVGHKKVTFYDKVTVYYVCNEEERKGHWEEFARDRCRFLRRIQETESVIGHCFTPDHRQRVWDRMQEIWGS
ncbi:protein phosphatase 1 regulatory subunit 15B [Phyllobates terribilis]|uniref:protein phosphatase 1 regulatory subunit 15B n=1 Tax=Phyllobates terribilis TaxID=111132 RepID=UPI003CCB38D7